MMVTSGNCEGSGKVKGQVKKRKHGERLGEKLDPPIMAAAHPDSSWR
jgi:hypothetical protein